MKLLKFTPKQRNPLDDYFRAVITVEERLNELLGPDHPIEIDGTNVIVRLPAKGPYGERAFAATPKELEELMLHLAKLFGYEVDQSAQVETSGVASGIGRDLLGEAPTEPRHLSVGAGHGVGPSATADQDGTDRQGPALT